MLFLVSINGAEMYYESLYCDNILDTFNDSYCLNFWPENVLHIISILLCIQLSLSIKKVDLN